jgi:hypothetical protein
MAVRGTRGTATRGTLARGATGTSATSSRLSSAAAGTVKACVRHGAAELTCTVAESSGPTRAIFQARFLAAKESLPARPMSQAAPMKAVLWSR